MYKGIRHIHFVGIGGAGMSGIAEVLVNLQYRVSGSDLKETESTRRLVSLGALIHYGHDERNVEGADVVVVSSAIKPNNPEVTAAHERSVPVIPRAEMLAELMRLKYGIAVAGSHGKTTTTSLIATVLARGGIDPTFVIGGKLNTIGANAVLGDGEFLVAEADESDGSFLKLSPTIAIITNIDLEHLDHYGTIDALKDTFLQFANKVPFYGLAILCIEDTHIQEIMPRLEKRYTTYGTTPQADFQARSIAFNGLQTSFELWHQGTCKGHLTLKMPGVHNVYNALAAVSVAHELTIPFDVTREALSNFEGVQRRFQIRGEVGGVKVLDDYAHHPSEIKATLTAAKQVWDGRTLVVFQPHRFTRTRDVRKEFLTAFYQADALIVTDIYPAGENPIPGVTATSLVEGIKEHGHKHVVHLPDREELVRYLLKLARPGDVVITVGAGDVWQIGEDLLERLKK